MTTLECLVYGSQDPDAPTVLAYGNCQVPFLCEQLSRIDDLNAGYRFVVALNHGVPELGVGAPQVPDRHFRHVALYLSQYEDRPDNPARIAVESRLPAGCPVVTFPSFVMNSPWPFECPEPRVHAEPDYPWGRYPFGDMIGLQIAKSGLPGPLAVAAYLDLADAKLPDIAVRLERDLHRMRHYDAHCDVQLSDYVLAEFRRHHLFWTAGHLSAHGVAELTRRVTRAARPVLGGSAERTDACLAAGMGYGGMGGQQLPIHPRVAQALGLAFWEPDQKYRWYGQSWTFFEYLERYIPYDTSW